MPATPTRATFIRQEFRSVTVGPNTTIDNLYGGLARRTSEAVETFFETSGDANIILTERVGLLGANRRRMVQEVAGEQTGLNLTYVGASPTAKVVDDERRIDHNAVISEITVNFAKETTQLESWGG